MALLVHKWLFLVASLIVHPLFVSVTEINHNAQDKTLEISCKVFTDDLEIDLFTVKDKAAANKAISDYFRKHLALKADGKAVQMELIGFEREGDATWSYFQVPNISSVKKIEVDNNILYEASDQEINLMHVTVNKDRKSTKIDYPDVHAVFEF